MSRTYDLSKETNRPTAAIAPDALAHHLVLWKTDPEASPTNPADSKAMLVPTSGALPFKVLTVLRSRPVP